MARQAVGATAAHIVYALKDGGNIDDDRGKATSILVDRVNRRGLDLTAGALRQQLINLEKEGLVKREIDPSGKATYAIKLKKVGRYTDPGIGTTYILPSEKDDNERASYTPRRSSLEKIIDSVKRLPVGERLMVCGAIIDEVAGVMDEREKRIKAALSDL